jgi:threonine dehydratase
VDETSELPALAGIEAAASLLGYRFPETPLIRSELLSDALQADVWLKNETVSPVASFKWRGAMAAIDRASRSGSVRAAVTSSTGNHGQGVAWAAREVGLPAHIFLPERPNPVKRRMIEAFGGTVHVEGRDIDDAKQAAQAFADGEGFLFVDDGESRDMMEGAGTVGLEIARRLSDLDVLIAPLASGTLVVGAAAAVKALQPRARVIAVQAKGSPAMVESFHARRPIELPVETVAEGLACRVPARRALEGMWAFVDDALAVSDEALLAGVRALAETSHVLVEPAGAAALAGARERRDEVRGRRIAAGPLRSEHQPADPAPSPGRADPGPPAVTGPTAVRLIGDPVLREPAEPVGDVAGEAFRAEARTLLATLDDFRSRHGFGRAIAGPQIGVSKRFIAMNLGTGPFLVIDPDVTWRSEETFTMWDDCMSFPWLMVRLRRHRSLSLEYTDGGGSRRGWEDVDPATAELLQHELDHLDGILALDRVDGPTGVVARELFERDQDRFTADVDYVIAAAGAAELTARRVPPHGPRGERKGDAPRHGRSHHRLLGGRLDDGR